MKSLDFLLHYIAFEKTRVKRDHNERIKSLQSISETLEKDPGFKPKTTKPTILRVGFVYKK